MPDDVEPPATLDEELVELMRLVELLDKSAAHVRQLIYRVRPALRHRIDPNAKWPRTNGDRRRQNRRRDDEPEGS